MRHRRKLRAPNSGPDLFVDWPVTNLSALANLSSPDDGNTAWVQSLDAVFVADTASVLAPDGATVIAAAGGGNWVRRLTPSLKWQARAQWFIDSVSGSDEGDGETLGTALQTWAELYRRVGDVNYTQDVRIDIPNGLATGDYIRGNWTTTRPLRIVGAPLATLASGSFTGVTPATSSETWLYDDTGGIDFSLYQGQRMRITSGPRAGAVSSIAKDISSTRARGPSFVLPTWQTGFPITIGGTPVTAEVGDEYVVETLATIDTTLLKCKLLARPSFSSAAYLLADMHLLVPEPAAFSSFSLFGGNGRTVPSFFGCKIANGTGIDIEGGLNLTACVVDVGVVGESFAFYGGAQGAVCQFNDCAIVGTTFFESIAPVIDDSIFQDGAIIALDSQVTLKRVGVENSTVAFASSGILAVNDSQIRPQDAVWGSGHDRYGLEVEAGSSVLYTTKPTITGTLNDTLIGGVATAYAGVPATTAAKLAMIQDL